MQDSNKKPTSLRRQAASRANGAKSHGPVTPEGKARSAQNAVKHGLLADLITHTPEEGAEFDKMLHHYLTRLDPRDQLEYDLVEQIVVANFRLRQAWGMETALLGLQMELDKDAVSMQWRAPSEFDRRALAFTASIQESNALPLIQRYARSLANQAERALKLLNQMKKERLPPAPEPAAPEPHENLRNEPSPTIEHPETEAPEAQEPAPMPAQSQAQLDLFPGSTPKTAPIAPTERANR